MDSANSKSYVFLLENHSRCQIYLHFFLHPMNRAGRTLFAEVPLRQLNMVLPIPGSFLPRPRRRCTLKGRINATCHPLP